MRLRFALITVFTGVAMAQPVIPSRWEGRAVGVLRGARFELPVTIELKAPIPWEKNPFNLFIGTVSVNRLGDFGLMSATEMGTGGAWKVYRADKIGVYDQTVARSPGRGNVTLQYLTVRQQGNVVTAVLTETQQAAAAAANIFTGPNVSAMEASDVMREVMRSLGPTEMFAFGRGASLRLEFRGNEVTGSVAGAGRSVTNTTSDVRYDCSIRARRVK